MMSPGTFGRILPNTTRRSSMRVLASALIPRRHAMVSRQQWLTMIMLAGQPFCGAAAAQAPDATRSIVTTIELKTCNILKRDNDGPAWRCAGLAGYPVYIAERDDRYFFSAGLKPEKRRASQQTLRAANTFFPAAATRATVEWRVPRTSRRAVPYATIIRYYTSSETASGQVLVVSKVAPDQTCQVALIDAVANPDAIERARQIADTVAREFDCSKPPTVEGIAGKSPM